MNRKQAEILLRKARFMDGVRVPSTMSKQQFGKISPFKKRDKLDRSIQAQNLVSARRRAKDYGAHSRGGQELADARANQRLYAGVSKAKLRKAMGGTMFSPKKMRKVKMSEDPRIKTYLERKRKERNSHLNRRANRSEKYAI